MNDSRGIPDKAATNPPELMPPEIHLPSLSLEMEMGRRLDAMINLEERGEFIAHEHAATTPSDVEGGGVIA